MSVVFSAGAMAMALTASSPAQQGEAWLSGEMAQALSVAPKGALAVVVVPNMKYCSDEISRCMDGMDRGGLLLGSRPLDQFKSYLGFNVGINDVGWGVAAIMPPPEGLPQPDAQSSRPAATPSPVTLWVLPVNDAQTFLQDNFTPAGSDPTDGYKTADGRVIHARAIEVAAMPEVPGHGAAPAGQYVMLSSARTTVQAYMPDEQLATYLRSGLGPRGTDALTKGEMFIMATPEGLKRAGMATEEVVRDLAAGAGEDGASPPGMPRPGEMRQMFGDAHAAAMAIDFDPLGLIVRWLGTFSPETTWWARSAGAAHGTDGLARMPRKTFLVSGAFDVNGFGGFEMFRELMATRSITVPDSWRSVEGIAFTLAPSSAGLSAGLLAESALLLQSSNSEEVAAAAREWVQLTANGIAPPGVANVDILWEEMREVKDVGTAMAYDVKFPAAADEPMQSQLIRQIVFGRNGWKGFIKPVSNGAIVTFSQRPAVLASALQAAEAKPATSGEQAGAAAKRSQADDGAIKMIRRWLPANRDVEMYISLGQIAAVVQPIMQMMGGPEGQGPTIDPNLPPVGIGGDLQDHGFQGAVVVPGAVLATLLDQAASMFPPGASQPVHAEGGAEH